MGKFYIRYQLLILAENMLTAYGLKHLLDGYDNFNASIASSIEQGCKHYLENRPNIVLIDMSLSDMGWLGCVRRIRSYDTGAKVILLSDKDDEVYISTARKMGVLGFINKKTIHENILECVQNVLRGNEYFPVHREFDEDISLHREHQLIGQLTTREFEIYCLLVEGHNVGKISNNLHISPKTVSNHRASILRKLQVTSVVDLAKYAIRNGIIEL